MSSQNDDNHVISIDVVLKTKIDDTSVNDTVRKNQRRQGIDPSGDTGSRNAIGRSYPSLDASPAARASSPAAVDTVGSPATPTPSTAAASLAFGTLGGNISNTSNTLDLKELKKKFKVTMVDNEVLRKAFERNYQKKTVPADQKVFKDGDIVNNKDTPTSVDINKEEIKKRIVDKKLTTIDSILEKSNSKESKNLKSLASNPKGFIQGGIANVLAVAGPYGLLASLIVGMVLESPKFIKALAVKGGPLNQDFDRKIAEEVQLGIERNEQWRRARGLDIVITTENRNYIIGDPAFWGNSSVDNEATRVNRLSSNETKYGYSNGL